MKIAGLVIAVFTGIFLIYAAGDFPKWADPSSPASTYLSPHFIEKAMEETSVPNVVTAVLADYRGFDTMFETTVIFSAGRFAADSPPALNCVPACTLPFLRSEYCPVFQM